MNHWNRTGVIKAIMLVGMALPNLINPVSANPQQGMLASVLMPLLFGTFSVPLIIRINRRLMQAGIRSPHWNDNPLALSNPLPLFQFFAWLMLAMGTSMLVGSAWRYGFLNQIGLMMSCFGGGQILGLWLTVRSFGSPDAES